MTEQSFASFFAGKVILVTGGTGSFGKAITKALLPFRPAEIRIYSRTEDKQDTMQYQFKNEKNIRYILGDIRDAEQLTRATYGVDYIFHAAAQKQVPTSEINVLEGIKTNILGAQNVIDAALKNKVKKVIAVSTDKAVEPLNAMGMTKALQEKLFIQANIHPRKCDTVFACVRYGNVLGSTGSVFPLFLKQIANNHHLTLTDKRMTRFLITLEETTTLVFTAMKEAVGGEIFIPTMRSHTILDMAEIMQEWAKSKNQQVEIIESGIRVGEKLHETLIHPTDSLRTIKMKNYFIILPDISIPQTSKKYATEKKAKEFRYSSDTGKMLDKDKLKQILTKTGLFS